MGLYIIFFPQLIAGPIVRYDDIREQLKTSYRTFSFDDFSNGIWRFSIGLSKKVLIANNLGSLADLVFGVRNISEFSVLYTWLGAIAYTLQIYYDFSGYSDMAIGLGRIFGFRFKENFNYPYSAISVKDFWRRWHISLSSFFRDYVYIPLGGNRCSTVRWIFNMVIVWLLTGIWHGASWHYILWGVIYGWILIAGGLINRSRGNPKEGSDQKLRGIIYNIVTMLVVTILWVLFRSSGMTQFISMLKNMFGIGASSFANEGFWFQFGNYWLIILIAIIFSHPVVPVLRTKYGDSKIFRTISVVFLLFCVVSSISFIYMGSYNPFLYFMF